ncbi:hypothetical protein JRQ81_019092 [Phrynocephalus forsythii]|uniref:Uncharacterized protein n=1 Tax=Phrynocephalus forsythii TaxID=171643 RepID=A0A9Q1AY64_9SAUR|nr:hypothetical protein JRQ81_019092 [Phrynocephalus forsythii]
MESGAKDGTNGFLFVYGHISWASCNQDGLALPFTESMYMTAAEASRDMLWLQKLQKNFGTDEERPVKLMEDYQKFIKLAQRGKINIYTKLIGLRYRYVRSGSLTPEDHPKSPIEL